MRYEVIHLKDHFPFLGANGCDPTLELYLPYNMTEMNRQDQKRPCMLICPGGAYAFCSQREAEPIALHLLPEGFNVFILTYSTAPNRFPTQLREVAAAMELIYRNSGSWNCDTNRVAIMGFSAGGHLAAHYSTSFDCDGVRQVFPESKCVNASVLCYPVISTDTRYSHRGSFENLLGHYPETPEETIFFSCDRQVSDHTPPAFLWHTAADGAVPVKNSLLYAGALADRGIPFELHVYPYGGHGLATADVHSCDGLAPEAGYVRDWLPAMKQWLNLIFHIG